LAIFAHWSTQYLNYRANNDSNIMFEYLGHPSLPMTANASSLVWFRRLAEGNYCRPTCSWP